jgi:hypothetical protein
MGNCGRQAGSCYVNGLYRPCAHRLSLNLLIADLKEVYLVIKVFLGKCKGGLQVQRRDAEYAEGGGKRECVRKSGQLEHSNEN